MTEKTDSLTDLPDDDIEKLAATVLRTIGPSQAETLIADLLATTPAHNWPSASVEILEQPASKAHRFRYECEGRSAGSIPGASQSNHKTYPTIRVNNFEGHITIRVSCVTKDTHMAHPNGLVGKHCQKGVFIANSNVTADVNIYPFTNLGIQCTKIKAAADALKIRKNMKVDPFKKGFHHISNPAGIDRHAVRLAFEVFSRDASGKHFSLLQAVASDIVYDKKAMGDLVIADASHDSGPMSGGTQIFVFCDKVTPDTQVQFYEKAATGAELWSSVVAPTLVHKHVALKVTTPRYTNLSDPRFKQNNISVHYRLIRYEKDDKSGATKQLCSNSHPFTYIPDVKDTKKRKTVLPCLLDYDEETLPMPLRSTYELSPPIMPKTEPQQQWSSPKRSPSTNPFMEFKCDTPYASPQNADTPYAGSPSLTAGCQPPPYSSGPPPYTSGPLPYWGNPSQYACVPTPDAGSPAPYAAGPQHYACGSSPYSDSLPPYATHDLNNMGGSTPCSPCSSGTPPFERFGSPNASPFSYATRDSPGAGAIVSSMTQCSPGSPGTACTQTLGSFVAGGNRPYATPRRAATPRLPPPNTDRRARADRHAVVGIECSPASLLDSLPPHPDLQSPMAPLHSPPTYQMAEQTPAAVTFLEPLAESLIEVSDSVVLVDDEESLSEVLRRLSTNETYRYCQ